mgnify:CR=1 FL=1
MTSMLDKVKKYIQEAHDEVILWKRWDIKIDNGKYYDAMSRMYPFTHKYYFEANPSLICDYKNLLDMQRQPLIMLRDGLIPLICFFAKNHKPPANFSTIFLIDKRFESIIPKSWSQYFCTYEVELPYKDPKELEKIYINGMLVSYTFWFDTPVEALDKLDKIIPKNVEREFLTPIRERAFFITQDETKYVSPFLEEIYDRYGTKVKLHTNYDKLLDIKFTKGAGHCELVDTPYLYTDNYFNHLFSHNECFSIHKQDIDKSNALIYPLSMNHNVIIKESDPSKSQFGDLIIRMREDRANPDILNYNFHQLIRKYVKAGLVKV